jgi:hypothetical protein
MPRNSFAANRKRFDALLAEFLDAAAENLAPGEKLLMQRIAESDEAAAIFARVEDDNTVKRLVLLCVEAHDLATNFHKLIADARYKLKKASAYGRAIATVSLRCATRSKRRLSVDGRQPRVTSWGGGVQPHKHGWIGSGTRFL